MVLNFALTCAAVVLVDRTIKEWSTRNRVRMALLLMTVPGAMFYAAFYSEAFFSFGVALALWGLREPRRTWWAVLGVAIASADRIIGIVLVLPLFLVLYQRFSADPSAQASARDATRRRVGAALKAALIAGSGLLGALLAVASILIGGGLHELSTSRNGFHTTSLPYFAYAARHASELPVVWFSMATFQRLPVERFQLDNVLPWSAGFYQDLLALPFAWIGARARDPVGIFAAVMVTATIIVGPPVSQMRFFVVLLPLWIVVARTLQRWRAGEAVLWGAIPLGLVANLLLMRHFITNHWAG